MSPATSSRFVRHDLMSTDPPAATRFYSELFNWKTTEISVMGFTVVRLTSADQVLGAIMPFDKSFGFPSHWIPYVSVESVDECCKRISQLGGEVCVGAMDIPPGRFAVANDPGKALFSPFTPKAGVPAETIPPRAGMFCWDELLTTDVIAARAFYTTLFGWESKEWDAPPVGSYTLLLSGDRPIAGIMKVPVDVPERPMWLGYVAVEDADATAARAEKLGGSLCAPPTDIPEVGRFAVLRDPTGGEIAILKGAGSPK